MIIKSDSYSYSLKLFSSFKGHHNFKDRYGMNCLRKYEWEQFQLLHKIVFLLIIHLQLTFNIPLGIHYHLVIIYIQYIQLIYCPISALILRQSGVTCAVLQVDDLSVVKLLQQFLPGLDAHAALQFRCTSACSSKTVTAVTAVCVQHCTSPRKNTIFVWSHLICTFYYFFQPIHRNTLP